MSDPLGNVDWCLLRAQRDSLLSVNGMDETTLDGLVNFLDSLIDHALDSGLLRPIIGRDEIELGRTYKYVRVNGRLRVFDPDIMHKQMVGSTEKQLGWLESAGKILVEENNINIVEHGSISLDIFRGDASDIGLLETWFGKPVRKICR